MLRREYGVSTLLYHGTRLGRSHLLEIAAASFETVELRATRAHFDYHHDAAIADLQEWLGCAGLTLGRVHAPVLERTVASADPEVRAQALAETERALYIARRIPFQVFVVHIGTPRNGSVADGSSREGARRSLESLQALATPLGVRIAVEVIQNELSHAAALAYLLDEVLDQAAVGICLDLGHAHLEGDVVEAIETVSEHVLAVDVHDNQGRRDEHLVPFEGTLDWPGALTSLQKIGYDGPLMLELHGRGSTTETLLRAQRARQKMDRLLAH